MDDTTDNPAPARPAPAQIDAAEMAHLVRAVIDARGLKQAAVARESGVSQTALSSFMRGSYGGDNAAVAEKLSAWLDNLTRRDRLNSGLAARPEFVETPTAHRIIEVCQYAQLAGDLAVVAGLPGIGKTATLEHYRATRPSAWLVTMSSDTEGVVPMLQEIGFALGLGELCGGAAKMRREIGRRIRNTAGVLLIDEAQHLKPKALECLRGIHDATGIGLVLCGHAGLTERVGAFTQLHSRVGKREVLGVPDRDDIAAIIAAFGVKGREHAHFLNGIGQHRGGLRCIVKTLRLASVLAAGDGVPVGLDHCKRAWLNLNLEVV